MKAIDNYSVNHSKAMSTNRVNQHLMQQPLAKPDQVSSADRLSLSNDNAFAQKVVAFHIGKNLESLGGNHSRVKSKAENNSEQPVFDHKAVVKTVMDFISESIYAAKDRGESNETLTEMFDQAKAGVNLGFDQALEELEELEKLNGDIVQGVDKSRALFTEQIDKLFTSFFKQDTEAELIDNSTSKKNEQ